MGILGESLLYAAAKRLYRTEIAQTNDMKKALSDIDSYDRLREGESDKVMSALRRYEVTLSGKRVLDFGCNDGALSASYLRAGAAQVIGLDIDERALERARALRPGVTFLHSGIDRLPLSGSSVDVIVSFDVLEHVSRPEPILAEMRRILAPGGCVVIGTIGWWSPFAPHLWSTMPVPWAHVLFSERTLLRACRRIYESPWYQPNMHDLDALGQRIPGKYRQETISRDYLNHYLVRDFEHAFREAGFQYHTDVVPVHGKHYLRPFCRTPWARELLGSSVWFVLMADEPIRSRARAPLEDQCT